MKESDKQYLLLAVKNLQQLVNDQSEQIAALKSQIAHLQGASMAQAFGQAFAFPGMERKIDKPKNMTEDKWDNIESPGPTDCLGIFLKNKPWTFKYDVQKLLEEYKRYEQKNRKPVRA